MTVSSEAKRTLVKSPPELWSELSDAESLARHLEGIGDIRVVRAEPETAVEWEAEGANGSVRLEPSGFGTKVTLSLRRELPPLQPPEAPEPSASSETPEPPKPEPVAVEPDPLVVEQEPYPLVVEPEPLSPVVEPEPAIAEAMTTAERPRGLFARLFRRRRTPQPSPEPERVEPEPIESEPAGPDAVEPEPIEPEPVEPEAVEPSVTGASADLATLEAEMAEQDQATLTTMLDRLGAAHHRPFSRS